MGSYTEFIHFCPSQPIHILEHFELKVQVDKSSCPQRIGGATLSTQFLKYIQNLSSQKATLFVSNVTVILIYSQKRTKPLKVQERKKQQPSSTFKSATFSLTACCLLRYIKFLAPTSPKKKKSCSSFQMKFVCILTTFGNYIFVRCLYQYQLL